MGGPRTSWHLLVQRLTCSPWGSLKPSLIGRPPLQGTPLAPLKKAVFLFGFGCVDQEMGWSWALLMIVLMAIRGKHTDNNRTTQIPLFRQLVAVHTSDLVNLLRLFTNLSVSLSLSVCFLLRRSSWTRRRAPPTAFGGSHSSNSTSLTQVFFKGDELCDKWR